MTLSNLQFTVKGSMFRAYNVDDILENTDVVIDLDKDTSISFDDHDKFTVYRMITKLKVEKSFDIFGDPSPVLHGKYNDLKFFGATVNEYWMDDVEINNIEVIENCLIYFTINRFDSDKGEYNAIFYRIIFIED